MADDSRWRPGKPLRIIPIGDVATASEWIPFARRKMVELSRSGDYARRTWMPAPGVIIRGETLRDIPRVFIEVEAPDAYAMAGIGFGGGRIYISQKPEGPYKEAATFSAPTSASRLNLLGSGDGKLAVSFFVNSTKLYTIRFFEYDGRVANQTGEVFEDSLTLGTRLANIAKVAGEWVYVTAGSMSSPARMIINRYNFQGVLLGTETKLANSIAMSQSVSTIVSESVTVVGVFNASNGGLILEGSRDQRGPFTPTAFIPNIPGIPLPPEIYAIVPAAAGILPTTTFQYRRIVEETWSQWFRFLSEDGGLTWTQITSSSAVPGPNTPGVAVTGRYRIEGPTRYYHTSKEEAVSFYEEQTAVFGGAYTEEWANAAIGVTISRFATVLNGMAVAGQFGSMPFGDDQLPSPEGVVLKSNGARNITSFSPSGLVYTALQISHITAPSKNNKIVMVYNDINGAPNNSYCSVSLDNGVSWGASTLLTGELEIVGLAMTPSVSITTEKGVIYIPVPDITVYPFGDQSPPAIVSTKDAGATWKVHRAVLEDGSLMTSSNTAASFKKIVRIGWPPPYASVSAIPLAPGLLIKPITP